MITKKYKLMKAETPKSWGIVFNNSTKVYWFPKSTCEITPDDISMPDWLWDKTQEDMLK